MEKYIKTSEFYKKLAEAYNEGLVSWGSNEIVKDIIGECAKYELPISLLKEVKTEVIELTHSLEETHDWGKKIGAELVLQIINMKIEELKNE